MWILIGMGRLSLGDAFKWGLRSSLGPCGYHCPPNFHMARSLSSYSPLHLHRALQSRFLSKGVNMHHCSGRWGAPPCSVLCLQSAGEAHLKVKSTCVDREWSDTPVLAQELREALQKLTALQFLVQVLLHRVSSTVKYFPPSCPVHVIWPWLVSGGEQAFDFLPYPPLSSCSDKCEEGWKTHFTLSCNPEVISAIRGLEWPRSDGR